MAHVRYFRVFTGKAILVIVYHLLLEETFYDEERYDRLRTRQEERHQQRAVKALEHLGYRVILEKVA